MSNLAKQEITALDISGNNYMRWAVEAKLHLRGKTLLDTLDKSKETSEEQKANAMIFLIHHIHDGLKDEYITAEDPADLWQSLKDRFDHQKYVILPKTRYEWLNLRFQDYKSISEYNSALFRIISKMTMCGEIITEYDKIEKTLQTFHPSNVVLQQQYRANGYKTYAELMDVLMVAEQNNELVMLNHQARPTGSVTFPEVNATNHTRPTQPVSFPEANGTSSNYNNHGRGRGRGNHRGRGRGGYGRGRGQGRRFHPYESNNEKNNKRSKGKEVRKKQHEECCYRCGMKGHWSRTCRTSKHIANLYQEYQKELGKQKETNFIYGNSGLPSDNEAGPSSVHEEEPPLDGTNDTFLDVADFAIDSVEINDSQNE